MPVVHQHLEARSDLPVPDPVHVLGDQRRERSRDHRAQEHRDGRADDDAHCRDRGDDAAALAVDHAAARVRDEERQQVGDHRPYESDVLREGLAVRPGGECRHGMLPPDLVGVPPSAQNRCDGRPPVEPADGDEQGRDQTPGDERRDVRHDHAGQEGAESLDSDLRLLAAARGDGR